MAISAAASLIGAAVSAATAVGTTVYSSTQQNKAEKRQRAYQQAILDEEAAAEAREKELAMQSKQRSKAYGASLLDSDTTLDNALTSGGFTNDLDNSYSLLGSRATGGANLFA